MKAAALRLDALAVYRALNRAYGPPASRKLEPPLNVLIATILSQNTSDVNSERAYLALRRRFPTWQRVAQAPLRAIEAVIRCGGLARIKAKRIQEVLRLIRQSEGRLSLGRIATLSSADGLAWLTAMPGIGLKTACCVLLFGFGRPVMPVDTHVYRIAGRLGWIRSNMPIDKVPNILESLVPARLILPLHLYLIAHGRHVCRVRLPKCEQCILAEYCMYFRKVGTF